MDRFSKPTTTPSTCPSCKQPFLVADEVLDVDDLGHWTLAMHCANCAWQGEREMDDTGIELLDAEAERNRDLMADAAQELAIAAELDEMRAFAEALRADDITPSDFS